MDNYSVVFEIEACNCCTRIIRDKINSEGKNEDKILQEFCDKHSMKKSLVEVKKIIKDIYFNNLDNDKYGINNYKEVV